MSDLQQPENFEALISGENKEAFNAAVKDAVYALFGSQGGRFHIDYMKHLSTSIECYQYAEKHMRDAKRFQSRDELLVYAFCKTVHYSGLITEFGVFSGHSVNLLATLSEGRPVYGFDSFEGLPEAWVDAPAGAFAVPELPPVRNNVTLIKGWFNETLRPFMESNPGIASFIHVDCDLYSSTKTILDEMNDRIVPGTIILFDEYFNYVDYKLHEMLAFREFVEKNNIKYEYIGLVPHDTQVAVKIL